MKREYARQKLYALGEPFGECCTQDKPGGRGRIYGGASSASTSSTQNRTQSSSSTTTQDRRQVTGTGSGAVNADNSSVNLTVNSMDSGAVAAGIGAAQTGAYVAGVVANNAINAGYGGLQHLSDQGTAMLNANTALANSITQAGSATATNIFDASTALLNSTTGKAFDTATALTTNSNALANQLNNTTQTTLQQIWNGTQSMLNGILSGAQQNQQTAQTLALAPMTQQNPDRYLIIGALAVVAVVAFSHMGK